MSFLWLDYLWKSYSAYVLVRNYGDATACELFLKAMDRGNILGVVTATGGVAHHFATVAREANISYVSGIGSIDELRGTEIEVDGTKGEVSIIGQIDRDNNPQKSLKAKTIKTRQDL